MECFDLSYLTYISCDKCQYCHLCDVFLFPPIKCGISWVSVPVGSNHRPSNCFTAKHAAVRSKNKDWLARSRENVTGWHGVGRMSLVGTESGECHWLARSRENVSERSYMSISGMLFQ